MPCNGEWEAGGGRGEAVSKRRRRRRKKATGTHVSKKGFLGFLQEEGEGARGWSAWGQRASGRGRGEGGREQLCLEVAPSILIDFICAHVSESERHAARWTERDSPGGLLSRENAAERARKNGAGGGGRMDGWMERGEEKRKGERE